MTQDRSLDDLFAPIGPLIYLIAQSADLAVFYESDELPDHAESPDVLLDGWLSLVHEVGRLIPPLAAHMDNADDEPLNRWSVDFINRLQQTSWTIRSHDSKPDKVRIVREFMDYLQSRHAELKAVIASKPYTEERPPTGAWKTPEQPTRLATLREIAVWIGVKDHRTVKSWADHGTISLEQISPRRFRICQRDVKRFGSDHLDDCYPVDPEPE